MNWWILNVIFLLTMSLLVNGKTQLEEIRGYEYLAAGLALIGAKLKRDVNIFTSIVKSRGYQPKEFSKKASAMMMVKFLETVDDETSTQIIEGLLTGKVNPAFDKYAEINYESIQSLSLTEKEQDAYNKIEELVIEGSKKFPEGTAAATKETEEEATWNDYIKKNKTCIIIGAVVLLSVMLISNFSIMFSSLFFLL